MNALRDMDHGTVHLRGGKPATGAKAWVFTRRKGERVPAIVYRDRKPGARCQQPLTVRDDGTLPGFVRARNVEVVASFRGRTADSGEPARRETRSGPLRGVNSIDSRGAELMVTIGDLAGGTAVTIDTPDYQPFMEGRFTTDLFSAPGFGVDATASPYFDTKGPQSERALLGISPNLDPSLILLT